jgi:NAD(P)-dependent dehydrogenase (short-subunit alcohol dehydrogenase family)
LQIDIASKDSIRKLFQDVGSFVRAAALEVQRGIRINAVSPIRVKETMEAVGMDSSEGMPADQTVLAYQESVEGPRNGEALDVRHFSHPGFL